MAEVDGAGNTCGRAVRSHRLIPCRRNRSGAGAARSGDRNGLFVRRALDADQYPRARARFPRREMGSVDWRARAGLRAGTVAADLMPLAPRLDRNDPAFDSAE